MRTGGGSTKRAVPISVLAAALTYGSMCSVSKEPVTQVIFYILNEQKPLLNKRLNICFSDFFFFFLSSSGCRCPEGQLLQDSHCVPVTECRCGIPSGNGTLEFNPTDQLTMDCNTWWDWPCMNKMFGYHHFSDDRDISLLHKHAHTLSSICSVCENGTLVCTKLPCPVYEPWSQWSTCSASCGRGQMTRTRLCQDTKDGPSCDDTTQTESCDMPACPGLICQLFKKKKSSKMS